MIRFQAGNSESIYPEVFWPEFEKIKQTKQNEQIQEQESGEVQIGLGEDSGGAANTQ